MPRIDARTGPNGETIRTEYTPEMDALKDAQVIDRAAKKPAEDWKALREERNIKLFGSDWISIKASDDRTAIPDGWATYRQALRDLPATTDDPANPTWPVAPA
jgi:hypothetical protein